MNAPGKKSFPTDGNQIDLTRYLPQMLNQVAARMNERLADELRTIDMPLPHWRIIAILKWRGTCSLKEVRQWTVIDTSTASRALKRLEDQGLVVRNWDRADTRARRLSLSPEGHQRFAEAWPIVAGLHQHVFGELPEGEEDRMIAVLQEALFRLGKSAWSDQLLSI